MLAQQLDRAFVRSGEAFEYFDGGCFAGAIWTKQTKTLAGEDFQIESVDGRYIRESLDQPRAAQRDPLRGGRRGAR